LAALPDIPTAAEQGYPSLVARLFVGLFAPAKTPNAIIARIGAVTQTAMLDPDLRKKFIAAGFEPVIGSDAASTRLYLEQEIVRWKPLLDRLHLGRN
jgi:tripartite-type tricarboxylate transporter receptor subunit TctC